MKDIGIGVLGVGMMGKYVCPINDVGDCRLQVRVLCDLNEETLREISSRYGVRDTTTSYDDMLARDDVDVVAIFTPDHLHVDHCLKAIDAGKHVVCTKPMVTSLAEAAKIVEAVEKAGVKFLVGQTMRYNLRMMAARRLFEDGELGDLIFADAYYLHDYRPFLKDDAPWRRDPPLDLLVGGGCHPIDLITWFMGPVEEVHAYANNGGLSPGYEIEDNFLVNLKFASGRIGRVMAAYGVVHPPICQIAVSLFGTKGTWIDDRYVLDRFETLPTHRLEFNSREQGHAMEVIRYLRHFEDCIVSGAKPLIGPREAAHVLAVTDAVWESVRTGAPVKVKSLADYGL